MALHLRANQLCLLAFVYFSFNNGIAHVLWWCHPGYAFLRRFNDRFPLMVQFAIVPPAFRSDWYLCRDVPGDSANIDQSSVGILNINHCFRTGFLHPAV